MAGAAACGLPQREAAGRILVRGQRTNSKAGAWMNELLRAADVARELSDASAPAPWSAGKQPEPLTERFLPFPIKALPAPIDRFVRAVAEATGTDPSWAALAALAVIAGCVGNRAALILKHGWVEPSVLWAAAGR